MDEQILGVIGPQEPDVVVNQMDILKDFLKNSKNKTSKDFKNHIRKFKNK